MTTDNGPQVVAVVHAKGYSERVPGKNLRMLGDRPLVGHAIRNAQQVGKIDVVVIDSDSDEILRVGESFGAVPWKRPAGLATNDTTGDDLAYWQSLLYPDAKILVQVVPTCPFTRPASIQRAISAIGGGILHDSAVGVISAPLYIWEALKPAYHRPQGRIPNSQEMEATFYETTGLYAVTVKYALSAHRRVSPGVVPVFQYPIEAIDINTEADWELAKYIWAGMQALKGTRTGIQTPKGAA